MSRVFFRLTLAAAILFPALLSADTVVTEIITQQVIQREVGGHINITKEEEQKFYDQHKSELSHPEQVRLSEILVSTEQAGDDQQKLDAAKAKADDLVKQIKAGANFDAIAKKESQGPSAA